MTDLDPRWSDALRRAGTVPVDLDADWARTQARAAAGPAVPRMDARPFRIPPRRQALAAAAVVVLLAGVVGALALRERRTQHVDATTSTTEADPGPSVTDVVVPDPSIDWTVGFDPVPWDEASDDRLEVCVAPEVVGSSTSRVNCGTVPWVKADGSVESDCASFADVGLDDEAGDGACVWTTVVPRGMVLLGRARLPGRPLGPAVELADVVLADVPVDWTTQLVPSAGVDPDDPDGEWCLKIERGGSGGGTCRAASGFVDGDRATQVFGGRLPRGGAPPSDRSPWIATVVVPDGASVLARAALGRDDPAGPSVDLATVPGVHISHLVVLGQEVTVLSAVILGDVDEEGESRPAELYVDLAD